MIPSNTSCSHYAKHSANKNKGFITLGLQHASTTPDLFVGIGTIAIKFAKKKNRKSVVFLHNNRTKYRDHKVKKRQKEITKHARKAEGFHWNSSSHNYIRDKLWSFAINFNVIYFKFQTYIYIAIFFLNLLARGLGSFAESDGEVGGSHLGRLELF